MDDGIGNGNRNGNGSGRGTGKGEGGEQRSGLRRQRQSTSSMLPPLIKLLLGFIGRRLKPSVVPVCYGLL